MRAVISCLLAALALSGGMQSATPVTVVQPQGNRDAIVPLGISLSPGDNVLVGERWF